MYKSINKSAIKCLLVSFAMLTTHSATYAEDAALEEVTVTAQRTAQNLQEVPVSVTAITESVIERNDIHDLTSIAVKTPSLSFAPFSPGQNIVTLRGISSNDDGAGTDGSVALFLDEVYLGRVSNINFEMSDLERIEVLRGPQGTLYGRNTIGGAINVISKKPSLDELYGNVKITLGTYNQQDIGAMVSVPFDDTVAMKFSFQQKTRDGWIFDNFQDQSNPFNRNTKNLGDSNTTNARIQLYAEPDDDTKIMFSYDQNTLDVNDMGRFAFASGPHVPMTLGMPSLTNHQAVCGTHKRGFQYCNSSPTDGFAKRDASGISLKVDAVIDDDGTTLTSITAMRSSLVDWEMDSDGAGPVFALIDNIYDETDQVSQEIRFAGGDEDVSYVVGLWFYQETTDRTEGFLRVTDVAPENYAMCHSVYNNYYCFFEGGESGGLVNKIGTTKKMILLAMQSLAKQI